MNKNIINPFLLLVVFSVFIEINGNIIKNLNKIDNHIHANEHNPEIDHEAFLGTDESKKFDNLTEEESKDRLRILITSKVDINRDGIVTEDELKQWISHISKETKERERDNMFKMYANLSDATLDYDVYFSRTYGSVSVEDNDEISKENLEKMKIQDNLKWKAVDENKDNKLDKSEFLVFLHPEDYPKMRSLVIQEALDISDKNKDGYIDLEEYINDIWSPAPGSEKPDKEFLTMEHDNFKNHRDLNKDGRLDDNEIGEWLMPSNYAAAEAETQHLMHSADKNKDGKLTMDEIMVSHDLFVGSQATDYGNTLRHEEL